jgi:hypothetical protein
LLWFVLHVRPGEEWLLTVALAVAFWKMGIIRMQNIEIGERSRLTSYRRMALASWRSPRDPSTYAPLTLRMDAAEAFMAGVESEVPLSITHYVAKVLGDCLSRNVLLNNVLLGTTLYQRAGTHLFITTLTRTKRGNDLAGFQIPDIATHSLTDVAALTQQQVEALRRNEVPHILRGQRRLERLPTIIAAPVFRIIEFLQYTLNLSLAAIGIPRDPYGSAIITNIGALGLDQAFIPLSPYARCSLIVGIGKPKPMPFVEGDAVVVAKGVTITFTMDHRYADGADGGKLLRRFRKVFENPTAFAGMFAGE